MTDNNSITNAEGYAAFDLTSAHNQVLTSQEQVQNQQAASQMSQAPTSGTADIGEAVTEIGSVAFDLTMKKPNSASSENIDLTNPVDTPDSNIFNEAGEAIGNFFEGVGEFLGGFSI